MTKDINPDEIVKQFIEILKDPNTRKEVNQFVKTSGKLTSKELDQEFTI